MSAPVVSPAPRIDRTTYHRLASRVKLVSWASLAYMTLEGGIAILAGILAGSVALIGFGLDSGIEGFASVIIIWRFTGARMFSEAAERRAQKLVAIQFFILAPYVGYESIPGAHRKRPSGHQLARHRPDRAAARSPSRRP
jgi:divalent metal cation (Fe/Co/Zn/Cd) transporter